MTCYLSKLMLIDHSGFFDMMEILYHYQMKISIRVIFLNRIHRKIRE